MLPWHSLTEALGYADDVVLLAPSPAALRMILWCCEQFANKHSLQFKPTNTQYRVYVTVIRSVHSYADLDVDHEHMIYSIACDWNFIVFVVVVVLYSFIS